MPSMQYQCHGKSAHRSTLCLKTLLKWSLRWWWRSLLALWLKTFSHRRNHFKFHTHDEINFYAAFARYCLRSVTMLAFQMVSHYSSLV